MISINELFKYNRHAISEITLSNEQLTVKVLNWGASVTFFGLSSDMENCVVSFKDPHDYIKNTPYLGATVGPIAGRIKDNRLVVNGQVLDFMPNNGDKYLHGGKEGISHIVFDYVYAEDDRFPSVVFTKTVNHKNGLIGKVSYQIEYKLSYDSLIVIQKAIPEIEMPLSLTNHMYFNLDHCGTIEEHILQIEANNILPLDENYFPTAERMKVVNTAFDFRTGRNIKMQMKKDHPQFVISRGYDHYYEFGLKKSIVLYSTKSKKSLTVNTSCDGAMIYSANFFDETFVNDLGEKAINLSGLAIEPQNLPQHICLKTYAEDDPFESVTTYTLKKR